jgi:hypothetical protein
MTIGAESIVGRTARDTAVRNIATARGPRRTDRRPQSLALEERFGQFAAVQRRLLLWCVALELWPANSKYLPSAPRASSNKTKAITTKRGFFTLRSIFQRALVDAHGGPGALGSRRAHILTDASADGLAPPRLSAS